MPLPQARGQQSGALDQPVLGKFRQADGVGAGIFVNGQIVYGASWAAGEIGYLHVPHIPNMQPALYEFGPLEQVLAAPGILKSWTAVAKKSGAALKPKTAVLISGVLNAWFFLLPPNRADQPRR